MRFLLAGLLGLACHKTGPQLCLDSDLGRFRFVSQQQSADECEATYQSRAGKSAKVRISKLSQGAFQGWGVPKKFEKKWVYVRRDKGNGTLWLSWSSAQQLVRLALQDEVVPAGPVLRAYLFHFPSDVVHEIEQTEMEVDALRDKSRHNPKSAKVHLELARKYRKLGKTVLADYQYKFAIGKDPNCYVCLFELGQLLFELRHWDLSIRVLRKAAKLEPKKSQVWLLLGDVSYHVHNRQEALRGYSLAMENGLDGEDLRRAQKRLRELQDGKFLIEVSPSLQKQEPSGSKK